MRRIGEDLERVLAEQGPKRVYIMSLEVLKNLARAYGKMSAARVFEDERRKREQRESSQEAQA